MELCHHNQRESTKKIYLLQYKGVFESIFNFSVALVWLTKTLKVCLVLYCKTCWKVLMKWRTNQFSSHDFKQDIEKILPRLDRQDIHVHITC